MDKVTATGTLFGQTIKVECEKRDGDLVLDFDGRENAFFEKIAREGLEDVRPVGGTYFPPANSLLNAYNYFQYYFFDKLTSIEIEGEIEEVPYEEGVIY